PAPGPPRGPVASVREGSGRLPAPLRILHRAAGPREQPQLPAADRRGPGTTPGRGGPPGGPADRSRPRPRRRRPGAARESGRAAGASDRGAGFALAAAVL